MNTCDQTQDLFLRSNALAICRAQGLLIPLAPYILFDEKVAQTPAIQTVFRVADYLEYLRREGMRTPFRLSAHTLADMIRLFDVVGPELIGFGYEQQLKLECEFLMRHALNEPAPIEAFLRVFINWRMNRHFFSCKLIGAGLYLQLLHRLIRFDSKFCAVDLQPIISILETCSIEFLLSEFNDQLSTPKLLENDHAATE